MATVTGIVPQPQLLPLAAPSEGASCEFSRLEWTTRGGPGKRIVS